MIINYTGISDNRIAPIVAKAWAKKPGQGLVLCSTLSRAKRIAGDLSFFSPCPVVVLPELELAALRYDAKSNTELCERLGILSRLCLGEQMIVVAPVLGALKKLPPADVFFEKSLRLKTGESFQRGDLIQDLVYMGYERNNVAESPGRFAVRGDIIDIFVPGRQRPYRIEFFDDEIDSMRSFDPETQRSIETLMQADITPAQLLVKDAYAYQRAIKQIARAYARAVSGRVKEEKLEKLRQQRDYLITCIEENMNSQYLEAFISYFYEEPSMIWDYMRNPSFIFADDPVRISETLDAYDRDRAETETALLERYQAVSEDFNSNPDSSDLSRINGLSDICDIVYCTPFSQRIIYTDRLDELEHIECTQAPVFAGHMDMLEKELKRYKSKKYNITIVCGDESRIVNLRDFIDRIGLSGKVDIAYGSLCSGTDFPGTKELYLSENDIFAHSKERRRSKKNKDREIKVFTDINKGDYVVHENHGVGRFVGVEKLEVDGSVRDYLKIQYAGADVLYIPVDQLESIQKYVGSEGVQPKINRLSGSEWQVTKAKAKAAIMDMAEDLIKVSAQRQASKGFAFDADSDWQRQFEDSFPYEETDDQLRCAEEIKSDMQSDKAMDRLLCGDVGYGKTEVAARAIFKCLEAGKQVAVLVPTTILANQHYHTFLSRFDGYPFAIEMLSRFRTDNQQSKIIKSIANGDVDLVVGTHRLLSQDVKFKDLGLLVVDEEQRFGVEHKEKIKRLKANVDVLTLSATPIPRTLHMSLVGLRDMSVIEEPPEDRYPVQTYVLEQDDNMIADAIKRELGRDGQVYVVYNRVRGIMAMQRYLQQLVPEAKIIVGHGQMGERELEDVMLMFTSGEYNVLLATTIIESGLDIPNVNTMIILDADRFGLSQLYQLRGRVGRSNRMAYAYLVYKKDKVLTELAEKRLRAIREFTEFGSGFRVAMRDLELRGAGNLLGSEQSGHILSIGYELYCKMVDQAVRELTGQNRGEDALQADTEVSINVSAFLPENYISDELTRLAMYKRIASVYTDDDRLEVTDELIDRFGDLPIEAENLLDVAMIRNAASRCGIKKVVQQGGNLVLLFEEENLLKPETFARLIDCFGQRITVYGGVPPRINYVLLGERACDCAKEVLECILDR